jgi:hypothetical protein
MEVIVTDEFLAWYHDPDLDEQIHDAARAIIVLLEQEGVTLKFPYQSARDIDADVPLGTTKAHLNRAR